MLDRTQTVAATVLDHSECAAIFQQHRIDFCCGGQQSIEAAARAKGVDLEALLTELGRAIDERRGGGDDPRELATPQLIERIVAKHHQYLRKALPFVQMLAAKVARVHGDHNPKLPVLDVAVRELAEALGPHLDEEEHDLFPSLTAAAPERARQATLLAAMHQEHLAVAKLLERIRAASEDFTLPPWACNSYRTLFSELQQLEGDVFAHVHLENNVLKPRFDA
ncbi:MAG: iron-sulfur cluster repair di-iron protein [Deltaproteobacteria bacterium]|nr:iron-sulfur cluster repair di-iron protein [Deltaproteobacteria bacterium]